jgi:type VI secretion system protein ImpL
MFKLLKNRQVLVVLGLLALVLLIWFFGEYFQILETGAARVAAIAMLVALFAVVEMFKRARAAQASNQLAAAVVNQAKSDQRPSADAAQLRERFEEALATLKQQKKRGGPGLYELPWYVIIGAPGSGKTTALKYSGLKFPLEQRTGRGALRGVGGTRNCDWWFTEEAVLLDTAGRYTTQDSDASADSAGWAEFLALLKKYRKRRPLNGVLLAISAHDLLTQGQAGREAHVAAARRRLNELNKELRIQLPVYVLVTKCDLLAGFSEYFEDMSQEARAQVFGVTFPREVTLKGNAAGEFPAEFDAIVTRLNQRVFARLEDERDHRRRARIFGFPQ